MAHFSDQTWADFVRGVALPGSAQELEAHLTNDCRECRSAFDVWRGLSSFAAREADYTPPSDLVRMVKLEFASPRTAQPVPWALAGMVFDSAIQPLPAGIRSAGASTRQVVYEGEGLTVDVRFEHKPHTNTVSATGQVLDKQVPLRWLGYISVELWTDTGRMLLTTEANNYGEFQFEFEAQEQLRIAIATDGRRPLRIPVGNLS